MDSAAVFFIESGISVTMETIAVIPARGGSKRIPRKNVRLFCGKPIICYSIEAAQNAQLFDEVIVSTDDEEIAGIAEECGASVGERRPAGISDDQTGVLEVVAHELKQLARRQLFPANVCLIYATAPMLRAGDLVESYALFRQGDVEFVFSAAEFPAPIFRAFTVLPDGRAKMFFPENYRANSQDLPRAYHDAAQFCWGRRDAILNPDAVVFSDISKPFVLPTNLVADIDTPEDWERAEWLYLAHQSLSSDD